MDDLRETLSTARRTHVFLTLASAAVLVAVAPVGTNFERALGEIRVLREVVSDDGYERYCGRVAQAWYDRFWGQIRGSDVLAESGIDLGGDGFVGHHYCPIPTEASPLEEYLAFLAEGSWSSTWVQMAAADPDSVAAVAVRNRSLGQLVGAVAKWGNAPLDAPRREPMADYSRGGLERSTDSVSVRLVFVRLDQDGGQRWFFADDSVVGLVRRDIIPQKAPAWLRQSRPELAQGLVATDLSGKVTVLPALTLHWEEVRVLTLDQAAQYLRARSGESQGNVEVFGLGMDTEILGWGGPTVILFLLVHLFLHLRHVRRLAGPEVELFRRFPWIVLFGEGGAWVTSVLTLWVLPVAAGGLVTYRVLQAGPFTAATAWSAAMTALTLSMGLRVVRELSALRARGGEPAPPAAS